MRRDKFTDDRGRRVRDGDTVRIITCGQIYRGIAAYDEDAEQWRIAVGTEHLPLAECEDIELIEGGNQ